MKHIFSILFLIACVAVNSLFGATVASAVGFTPEMGAIALNVISVVSGACGGVMPAGVLGAGVFTEVWTGYLNKAFRLGEEAIGWYRRIRSFDQHVQNDVIHLTNVGVKPEVLINNTTYPIGVSDNEDADRPIQLDKYQTKRTVVSDDTLHAISYDKIALDIEQHKEAIEEKKFAKAIHALAPDANAKLTPVVTTSGETYEGRKRLTEADLLKLKKAFDEQRVPMADRVLVLCPDHANDLLALDQKFAQQYADHETGRIGRKFGFEVYEFVDCPLFDTANGKKVPFGGSNESATMASVAFAASKAMRADGSLTMYHKEAASNPETQQNEINFRKYSICLPMAEECIGAIYSAKA